MDATKFFASIRPSLYGGRLAQSQVNGISEILAAWEEFGDGDFENLAYVLASAHHETGARMVPVREGFKPTDAAARAYVAAKGYRYATPVDGQVFYGRGLPQITWAANYKAAGLIVGADLYAHPELAMDPTISARLLIHGILSGQWNAKGIGIEGYLHGPGAADDDLMGARRTVNVTDRWELVGGYYRKFRAALVEAGASRETTPPPQRPAAPATAPPAPQAPGGLDPTALAAAGALAGWLTRCPGDPVAIGQWLAAFPKEIPT